MSLAIAVISAEYTSTGNTSYVQIDPTVSCRHIGPNRLTLVLAIEQYMHLFQVLTEQP
jgi:hypothetical protein